jgi:hypothetical protein
VNRFDSRQTPRIRLSPESIFGTTTWIKRDLRQSSNAFASAQHRLRARPCSVNHEDKEVLSNGQPLALGWDGDIDRLRSRIKDHAVIFGIAKDGLNHRIRIERLTRPNAQHGASDRAMGHAGGPHRSFALERMLQNNELNS